MNEMKTTSASMLRCVYCEQPIFAAQDVTWLGDGAYPYHSACAKNMQQGIIGTVESNYLTRLRDQFAGQAREADIEFWQHKDYTREQARYRYADAMLKAQEASHPPESPTGEPG